jgi:hypothetical protein
MRMKRRCHEFFIFMLVSIPFFFAKNIDYNYFLFWLSSSNTTLIVLGHFNTKSRSLLSLFSNMMQLLLAIKFCHVPWLALVFSVNYPGIFPPLSCEVWQGGCSFLVGDGGFDNMVMQRCHVHYQGERWSGMFSKILWFNRLRCLFMGATEYLSLPYTLTWINAKNSGDWKGHPPQEILSVWLWAFKFCLGLHVRCLAFFFQLNSEPVRQWQQNIRALVSQALHYQVMESVLFDSCL